MSPPSWSPGSLTVDDRRSSAYRTKGAFTSSIPLRRSNQRCRSGVSFGYSPHASTNDAGAGSTSFCCLWHMSYSRSASGRQSVFRLRSRYRVVSSNRWPLRYWNHVSILRRGTKTRTGSEARGASMPRTTHWRCSCVRRASIDPVSASMTTIKAAPRRPRISSSWSGNCSRTHCSPDPPPAANGTLSTSRPNRRPNRRRRKRRRNMSVWMSSQSSTKLALTAPNPVRSRQNRMPAPPTKAVRTSPAPVRRRPGRTTRPFHPGSRSSRGDGR